MKILRAAHLGWCFGVRDAVALVHQHARQEPVTVLGRLVHNPTVVADLARRGVRLADDPRAVDTRTVVITAHGISETRRQQVTQAVPRVVEATCPLVHHAHRQVHQLVQGGFHPLIIGQAGHVEVRGLTEDLESCDVVLSETDIDQLMPRPRFGVVAQTTQPIDRVRRLVRYLGTRFPQAEIRFIDTVCQPTKQRQTAAIALARQCNVVIVIGGRHSNNTGELARTCARFCRRVHRVETAADLDTAWFRPADTVGLTAGTSTPDDVIAAVEQRLAALQPPSHRSTGVPSCVTART